MTEWLTNFRCFLFGILNLLPSICANWWLVISPRILSNNLGITDRMQIVSDTGYLYNAGFVGVLIGTFLWPIIIKFASKKICIVLSNILMSISVLMMGINNSFTMFLTFRVVQGASCNIHTVGKDFIFDYFPEDLRQLVMNLDQIFALLGSLLGPLLGVFLYELTEESFRLSCIYIFIIGIVISLLTVIFFYVFNWKPLMSTIDLEEKFKLLQEAPIEDGIVEKNISEAFFQVMKKPVTRDLIITYAVSSACTAAELIISVIYFQADWNEGGLGISPRIFSMISAVSFVPSVYILLRANRYVPSVFSYKTTISFFIIVFSSLVLLTPAFRDLISRNNYDVLIYIVYAIQCIKFFTNSHIFSPFVHYLINKKLNKHIRTGINSINYFICMVSTIIMNAYTVAIFSWTMFSDSWISYRPFNKYVAFWMIAFTHLIPFFLLRRAENHKTHKRRKSDPHPRLNRQKTPENPLNSKGSLGHKLKPVEEESQETFGHVPREKVKIVTEKVEHEEKSVRSHRSNLSKESPN